MNDEEYSKTLWCGNLSEQVTEEVLYELFLQAGPLEKVRIPKDKDGRQKNFAFITYCHAVSVPYALKLYRGTALFHRTLSLQCRSKMAPLPPPIRATGPIPGMDFYAPANVTKQFAEMTERLQQDAHQTINAPRQIHEHKDKLVIASLQGNWTHRHHPYRNERPYGHDDFKNRDQMPGRERHNNDYKGQSRHRHSGNWRDRRNHNKYNHRRD